MFHKCIHLAFQSYLVVQDKQFCCQEKNTNQNQQMNRLHTFLLFLRFRQQRQELAILTRLELRDTSRVEKTEKPRHSQMVRGICYKHQLKRTSQDYHCSEHHSSSISKTTGFLIHLFYNSYIIPSSLNHLL